MDVMEFRGRANSNLDDETEALAHRIIGAAIEVHSHLGPGYPEVMYRKALSHEPTLRQIPHVCEAPIPVIYKGAAIGEGKVDILVAGRIVVELKSVECLNDVHRAQCIAYLTATCLELALLINFNVALLKDGVKRVILTKDRLRG